MPHEPRRRAARIVDDCFAVVVRDFMSDKNPKWAKLADATRDLWGRELRLAAEPTTLGAYLVSQLRSSLVQDYLDVLALGHHELLSMLLWSEEAYDQVL